jgi:hypothetical protein
VASLDSYLDRLTKKQLQQAVAVLALDKGVDLVTGGRLNKLTKKVLLATAKRLAPAAGRAGLSVGGAALGASRLLMTNPYILGGTAIYVGYQERDKIRSLLDQGYEIVEERLPMPSLPSPGIPRPSVSPSIPGVEEIITAAGAKPIGARRPSTFNKAVKAGMAAVKKDKTYGGKGKIKPAKKAFSVVVKMAAAKKKKKKAPKSGIRRRIWNAMKGLK